MIIKRNTHILGRVETWRNRASFSIMAIMVMALFFLSACGTVKPISMVSDEVTVARLDYNTNVFVLRPLAAFEGLYSEAHLDSSSYNGSLIETLMTSTSKRVLRKNKIPATDPAIQENILASNIPDDIRKKIPKLSRGITDGDSISLLRSMASYGENMAILVNYVDVKVGTRGTWDPNSGAITSGNSRSVFHAALLDCATGQLLWKNDVLLRALPHTSGERLSEARDLLFSNFPVREAQK